MDSFRDDYKRFMIFCHCVGPDCGPWTCTYTVWALDERSEFCSVLEGMAVGTFQSMQLASEAASEQAKRRIDALLETRALHAAAEIGS